MQTPGDYLRLDDYLRRMDRELQAAPEEQAEVMREIRSHLEMALCDAIQRSGGRDPAACLAQVLEQFGAVETIGRELRQVHGRATWREAGLAALPLLLFGFLLPLLSPPSWIAPLILAAVAGLAWRARWPLWWWAWLGWLPFAIPDAPMDLLWGTITYVVILLLVSRHDWLEATLAIYPLPTAWVFSRAVLATNELRHVGWNEPARNGLALGLALVWVILLVRVLRTPPSASRIARVLEAQAVILLLNGLTIVAARLSPTYPVPYTFGWRRFATATLPYALFGGMPILLSGVLASLPAVLAMVQRRTRRRPPSRPALSS